MQPVQLSVPGHEADEIVIAKNQPQYIPLPALQFEVNGITGILTRWRPSDEEREAIARGADIWLEQLTGGHPLQPIRLSAECPVDPDPSQVS